MVDAASSSSSLASSTPSSPSLSLARLAFVSETELEAAVARERDAAQEMCATGTLKGGEVAKVEGEGKNKEEWRAAVGPRSGRKLGKVLRRSISGAEDFLDLYEGEAKKLDIVDFAGAAHTYPRKADRTPPSSSTVPRAVRTIKMSLPSFPASQSFKLFPTSFFSTQKA
ncbi:hypothetical protein JCM10213_006313 [Rhodosporidiobolus nylandii]